MFGAVAKTWFAKEADIDPKKLFVVSIMPCVAKKDELTLPGMDDHVDLALTTREFARMVRACHINVEELEEAAFDAPLGESTGAGVIFGASGGVMEAALRTVYAVLAGKNPPPDAFRTVRGNARAPFTGVVEAEFDVPLKDGSTKSLRLAITSGLANTRRLVDAIIAGTVHYDFVEVMACPGGCAGGGGQPIAPNCELAKVRGARLWMGVLFRMITLRLKSIFKAGVSRKNFSAILPEGPTR
ncbi:hypothetical protein FACS1894110_25230 [Spirochaetia bacterium]|nr:hypothetical protein FACS1894110_25230 [Spirochaetia bacterium]